VNEFKKLASAAFGLGYSPWAPGTVGTLGGVAIAAVLAGSGAFLLWVLLAAAGIYLVARPLGDWAEESTGGKDPQWFVLDEVIGYLIGIAWFVGPSPLALAVAFVVFRFFDIVKPWPCKWLQSRRGGDGILLDDVAAGVWTLIVMGILRIALFDTATWTAR
jgi:phosphatidylglycerophosphatase A